MDRAPDEITVLGDFGSSLDAPLEPGTQLSRHLVGELVIYVVRFRLLSRCWCCVRIAKATSVCEAVVPSVQAFDASIKQTWTILEKAGWLASCHNINGLYQSMVYDDLCDELLDEGLLVLVSCAILFAVLLLMVSLESDCTCCYHRVGDNETPTRHILLCWTCYCHWGCIFCYKNEVEERWYDAHGPIKPYQCVCLPPITWYDFHSICQVVQWTRILRLEERPNNVPCGERRLEAGEPYRTYPRDKVDRSRSAGTAGHSPRELSPMIRSPGPISPSTRPPSSSRKTSHASPRQNRFFSQKRAMSIAPKLSPTKSTTFSPVSSLPLSSQPTPNVLLQRAISVEG